MPSFYFIYEGGNNKTLGIGNIRFVMDYIIVHRDWMDDGLSYSPSGPMDYRIVHRLQMFTRKYCVSVIERSSMPTLRSFKHYSVTGDTHSKKNHSRLANDIAAQCYASVSCVVRKLFSRNVNALTQVDA